MKKTLITAIIAVLLVSCGTQVDDSKLTDEEEAMIDDILNIINK